MAATVDENPEIPHRTTVPLLVRVLLPLFQAIGVRTNLMVPKDGSEAASMVTWSAVTMPNLVAHVDDYDVGQVSVARIGANAPYNISGIAGGVDGRVLVLVNTTSNVITLLNVSGLSAVENRMTLNGNKNINRHGSAMLWYDGTSLTWRKMTNTS